MNRRALLEMATLSAVALSLGDDASTAEAAEAVKVTELQRHPLAGSNGQQVVMVEVNVPPGGSSPPHRHSGPVFGYVLEGSIVFRLDDGPERTYRAGDVFHEELGQLHAVSRNPSRTKRARLLAVIIGPENQPVTTPEHAPAK